MPGAIGNHEYRSRHTGTLYVVGSAPCALEDLHAARQLCGTARVMAINEASSLVRADFIASLHTEDMMRFRREQLAIFGEHEVSTHTCAPKPYNPAVDYYWLDTRTGATSAWLGVKIGKLMGFTRIVLCGCPMIGGDGYAINTKPSNDAPRFGLIGPDHPVVLSHRAALKKEIDAGHGVGVYSMSGYTRELLGAPMETEQHAMENKRYG